MTVIQISCPMKKKKIAVDAGMASTLLLFLV